MIFRSFAIPSRKDRVQKVRKMYDHSIVKTRRRSPLKCLWTEATFPPERRHWTQVFDGRRLTRSMTLLKSRFRIANWGGIAKVQLFRRGARVRGVCARW